ncbi:MAG: GNAT family N-acetyltransferase [Planctomycetes bacterium]|nr:GNAT family N-acetyltransferase [Planctomycetota bacterium]
MPPLRAAASCVELKSDDSMVLAGSILAKYASEQEGKLRVCATVIEADVRLCVIACDVIAVPDDVADRAAKAIETECKIPFDHILICGSHTHHAPSTITVHGYKREEAFTEQLEQAIVAAARDATGKLDDPDAGQNDIEVEMGFALTQEATVGRNSRILLADDTIAWGGYPPEEEVRPTGPFDPDLAVIAFRKPGGEFASVLFNHSTHNIGGRGRPRGPAFYGLAAQEVEEQIGAPVLFLPGAFGSTHNQKVPPPEAIHRIRTAIERGIGTLRWGLRGPVLCLKRPFEYQVREFDEAKEDEAVRSYCEKHFPADRAADYVEVFRAMRKELAPHRGETRQTWLHAILLGDVALVGVPGEMFGVLGMAIRRRSPFRYTFVIGLSNGYIGYIPDREGMELGGYQCWTGFHSLVAPGTGERIVDEAVDMLDELHAEVYGMKTDESSEPHIRPMEEGDAPAIQVFFNTLPSETRRLFRPAGWNMSQDRCRKIVYEHLNGTRYDLVVEAAGRIVGWAWLSRMENDTPGLGIGIAEEFCGHGLGRRLIEQLIAESKRRGKKGIVLSYVQDNERAGKLYESLGFCVTSSHVGGDGESYHRMELRY